MVHVPIEDQHSLGAVDALRLPRRHDDVVVDAEAHPLAGHGVVAGRADQRVCGVDRARHHRVDRRDRATGREARHAVAPWPNRRTGSGVSPRSDRERGDARQVVGGVIDGELLVGGDDWLDARHPLGNPVQIEQMLGPADEGRARRVRDRLGEGIEPGVLD